MDDVNCTSLSNRTPSLRVGYVVEYSPFIIKRIISGSTSELMTGILVDMWRDYTKFIGNTIDFIEFDSYGVELSEGVWTGILGEINSESIDGCAEKFKITSNRIRDFMYTAPVVYSSDTYVLRQTLVDKFTPSSYLVFNPLHILLFITIVLVIAYFEQLIFNLRQRLFHPERLRDRHFFSLSSPFSFPFYPSHFIALLIIATTYIRFIYGSSFTGSAVTGGIDMITLKELQEQCTEGSRKLLLEEDLYFNHDKVSENVYATTDVLIEESELFGRGMTLPSPSILIQEDTRADTRLLCASDRFVMKTDTFGARKMELLVENEGEECKLTTVSPGLESDFPASSVISSAVRNSNAYAFFFNTNYSPRLIKRFNQVILKIYPFDMIAGYYWRRYTNRDMFPVVAPTIAFTYNPIKLKDVEIIFIILSAGLLLSLCIAVGEKLYTSPRLRFFKPKRDIRVAKDRCLYNAWK